MELAEKHFETSATAWTANVLNHESGPSHQSNSSESAGVKRFDNVVENDISFYQSLSNTTSFEKVRHHLFKKANSLLTGKSYEIPQEIVAQILSAQTTDEDKLNRASLIIMQQWPADDKKFTNILKVSRQ